MLVTVQRETDRQQVKMPNFRCLTDSSGQEIYTDREREREKEIFIMMDREINLYFSSSGLLTPQDSLTDNPGPGSYTSGQ